MRVRASRKGSALIELALLFSVLMLLLLGLIDFGLVIQQSMVVNEAAYAAAMYGSIASNSTSYTQMQTIATNSARGIYGFAAVATKWCCACSAGGTAVSCSSTCSSIGAPVAYVQVSTTPTASLLLNMPLSPLTVPLRGVCILRVQ